MLQAARELAQREGSTAGRVISDLARRGLTGTAFPSKHKTVIRGGVPLLPSRGEIVTLEKVARMMDEEGL